jgi:thiol-disulfide isomerase/thioredoxin
MMNDFYTYGHVHEIKRKDVQHIQKKNKTTGIGYYTNDEWYTKTNTFFILYAPWCQHCVESVSMFENLATQLYYKVGFCAINSDDLYHQNDHVVAELNVSEYPTLVWVVPDPKEPRKFTYAHWKQPISENSILQWIYK